MKHKIVIRDWTYDCGEPSCCSDYGTELVINDQIITKHFYHDDVFLEELFEALGIVDYEIEAKQEDSK